MAAWKSCPTRNAELRQSKRLALSFFVGAAVLFAVALVLSAPGPAMVDRPAEGVRRSRDGRRAGRLVRGRRAVPAHPDPFVSRHTEIIPANKDRIADNLAAFVHEKFLDTDSIVRLIQRHDPAQKVADWLTQPENTEQPGRYLVRVAGWALDFIEDAAVQNFVRRAVHGMIEGVDLSQTAGTILESVTRDGRHQELLDEGIAPAGETAGQRGDAGLHRARASSTGCARNTPSWKRCCRRNSSAGRARTLRSSWRPASSSASARTREHPLRQPLRRVHADFIERLQDDPAFMEKGEDIKRYLIGDETLNGYSARCGAT